MKANSADPDQMASSEGLLMSTHDMFSSKIKKNINFLASRSWLDKLFLIIYLSVGNKI